MAAALCLRAFLGDDGVHDTLGTPERQTTTTAGLRARIRIFEVRRQSIFGCTSIAAAATSGLHEQDAVPAEAMPRAARCCMDLCGMSTPSRRRRHQPSSRPRLFYHAERRLESLDMDVDLGRRFN